MFQRFREWLATFSLPSKLLAVLWFIFTVVYFEDEDFHDNIFKLFTLYPHLSEILVGFFPALMVFCSRKNEDKPQ